LPSRPVKEIPTKSRAMIKKEKEAALAEEAAAALTASKKSTSGFFSRFIGGGKAAEQAPVEAIAENNFEANVKGSSQAKSRAVNPILTKSIPKELQQNQQNTANQAKSNIKTLPARAGAVSDEATGTKNRGPPKM
jgi:hypothetical protein